MILVTGGAGFIGSNFILNWLERSNEQVINLDKLTFASNTGNLSALNGDIRHYFIHGDIADSDMVRSILNQFRPRAIVNLAAESNVERCIAEPGEFVKTNINGTFVLLDAAREYWSSLPSAEKSTFRFLQVSTDDAYELFGNAYAADVCLLNTPYSASKAASDHLVRAYFHTYGLPVIITCCAKNYGPYQSPENMVPSMMMNALDGKRISIPGNGQHAHDWIFVSDHCSAIRIALDKGKPGKTYYISGGAYTNIEVIDTICSALDELRPALNGHPYSSLISCVNSHADSGNGYAIKAYKRPRKPFCLPENSIESGIRKTVEWYLANMDWMRQTSAKKHDRWNSLEFVI
jgi:dTDP-glucose 4,6-dehydratase